MAEFSDEINKTRVADLTCVGKLLEDSKAFAAPGARRDTGTCLNFMALPSEITAPVGIAETRPAKFNVDTPLYTGGENRSVVKAYVGIASNLAPGQPLAFDTDGRRLNIPSSDTIGTMPKIDMSPPGRLKFDQKFSGALVVGVNVQF